MCCPIRPSSRTRFYTTWGPPAMRRRGMSAIRTGFSPKMGLEPGNAAIDSRNCQSACEHELSQHRHEPAQQLLPLYTSGKPGAILSWRCEPLPAAAAFLHLLHPGPGEILPPLRIRELEGAIAAGELAAAGLCGLPGAGAAIRFFSLHGLLRL